LANRLGDIMSDDPAAAALITSHIQAALRQARYWQGIYPHGDVEPAVMQALYLAAFTYRPGGGTFYWWFKNKLRGQLTNFRRSARRRQVAVQGGLNHTLADEHYYYLESHVF
jgi:hypothetical protein